MLHVLRMLTRVDAVRHRFSFNPCRCKFALGMLQFLNVIGTDGASSLNGGQLCRVSSLTSCKSGCTTPAAPLCLSGGALPGTWDAMASNRNHASLDEKHATNG